MLKSGFSCRVKELAQELARVRGVHACRRAGRQSMCSFAGTGEPNRSVWSAIALSTGQALAAAGRRACARGRWDRIRGVHGAGRLPQVREPKRAAARKARPVLQRHAPHSTHNGGEHAGLRARHAVGASPQRPMPLQDGCSSWA